MNSDTRAITDWQLNWPACELREKADGSLIAKPVDACRATEAVALRIAETWSWFQGDELEEHAINRPVTVLLHWLNRAELGEILSSHVAQAVLGLLRDVSPGDTSAWGRQQAEVNKEVLDHLDSQVAKLANSYVKVDSPTDPASTLSDEKFAALAAKAKNWDLSCGIRPRDTDVQAKAIRVLSGIVQAQCRSLCAHPVSS